MTSCLVIFGQPHSGKTMTSNILHKAFDSKEIQFDFIISFIAEYLRLTFEKRKSGVNFMEYFPPDFFENCDDLNEFIKDLDKIISENLNSLKIIYEKSIKETIPNSSYKPGLDLENASRIINLGVIGDSLESLAHEILNSVIEHVVKHHDFFIVEGYYFNPGKNYRNEIEKFCKNVIYLECFYNSLQNISSYIINNEKILTVTDVEKAVRKPKKKYQTFSESEVGDSPSYSKLKQLEIPEELYGKTILDIGCNEGFYCFECEKRGANVIGIETNKIWYSLALERKNEFSSFVNFLKMDWKDIPSLNYKFDLILFLASFHYIINNQVQMLTNIFNKMKKGGVLILEIGLSDKKEGKFNVEEIKRPTGEICQYPNQFTIKKLLNDVGFDSVIFKGSGHKIGGDPIPRFVIHAVK